MPNWCYNTVTFEHDNPEMIAKLIEAASEGKLFDAFVPMPEEIRNTTSPGPDNRTLIEKYGHSDWYSWSIDNWGTKWEASVQDVDEYNEGKGVQLYLETAWSPPISFYNKMIDQGFRVDASYTEEGMGFAGVYVNGEDKCVDMGEIYQSETAQSDIDSIEDDDLRIIVQEEYDRYKEYENE